MIDTRNRPTAYLLARSLNIMVINGGVTARGVMIIIVVGTLRRLDLDMHVWRWAPFLMELMLQIRDLGAEESGCQLEDWDLCITQRSLTSLSQFQLGTLQKAKLPTLLDWKGLMGWVCLSVCLSICLSVCLSVCCGYVAFLLQEVQKTICAKEIKETGRNANWKRMRSELL